jgi:putative two-component system response regulator
MAVANVYDALISARAYKKAMSHERAAAIIAERRGTHFDPDIVDAFLSIQLEFKEIAVRFRNQSTEATECAQATVGPQESSLQRPEGTN